MTDGRKDFEIWAKTNYLDSFTRIKNSWTDETYLPFVEAMWVGWKAASKYNEKKLQKNEYVLVPIKMTKAMEEVVCKDEWEWADVLVAAESVTEQQYEISLNQKEKL